MPNPEEFSNFAAVASKLPDVRPPLPEAEQAERALRSAYKRIAIAAKAESSDINLVVGEAAKIRELKEKQRVNILPTEESANLAHNMQAIDALDKKLPLSRLVMTEMLPHVNGPDPESEKLRQDAIFIADLLTLNRNHPSEVFKSSIEMARHYPDILGNVEEAKTPENVIRSTLDGIVGSVGAGTIEEFRTGYITPILEKVSGPDLHITNFPTIRQLQILSLEIAKNMSPAEPVAHLSQVRDTLWKELSEAKRKAEAAPGAPAPASRLATPPVAAIAKPAAEPAITLEQRSYAAATLTKEQLQKIPPTELMELIRAGFLTVNQILQIPPSDGVEAIIRSSLGDLAGVSSDEALYTVLDALPVLASNEKSRLTALSLAAIRYMAAVSFQYDQSTGNMRLDLGSAIPDRLLKKITAKGSLGGLVGPNKEQEAKAREAQLRIKGAYHLAKQAWRIQTDLEARPASPDARTSNTIDHLERHLDLPDGPDWMAVIADAADLVETGAIEPAKEVFAKVRDRISSNRFADTAAQRARLAERLASFTFTRWNIDSAATIATAVNYLGINYAEPEYAQRLHSMDQSGGLSQAVLNRLEDQLDSSNINEARRVLYLGLLLQRSNHPLEASGYNRKIDELLKQEADIAQQEGRPPLLQQHQLGILANDFDLLTQRIIEQARDTA